MIKLIENENQDRSIRIRYLKPLQVAEVIGGMCDGAIVMRTASWEKFEVMIISNPGPNRCWTNQYTCPMVKALGASVKINIYLNHKPRDDP